MFVSSRTPEGTPGRCPVCGAAFDAEPSRPPGDSVCPNCGHLVWFVSDRFGDVRVIRPTGRLLDAEELGHLFESLAIGRGTRIVLDLEQVEYVSSSALSKLINMNKKLGAARGQIRLQNLHPDLREVLRITRLDYMFDFDD